MSEFKCVSCEAPPTSAPLVDHDTEILEVMLTETMLCRECKELIAVILDGRKNAVGT